MAVDTSGLRRKTCNGYALVYVPDHPGRMKSGSYKNWEYEHRYVMEMELGRLLESHEIVHHLNDDRLDNRPENLVVMTRREHAALHYGNWPVNTCPTCGKPIARKAKMCLECRRKKESVLPTTDDTDVIDAIAMDVMENGFAAVARKLGSSATSLRKWLKRHGFTQCGRRRFASPYLTFRDVT